ncbi:helix-turn-helix transcriptional regulator [Bifidobacterium sp. ESL0764]|uniref:helix-turn-helix domain-containing protein n=1 Tax=Bifidobacterium sp. ESL0764 TaxID=2983228 RepID=UPI0023F8BF6B|nr:helix-turn-helix transcriptional regulator [Bifidobacterium sp. ESL0764]WEV66024.1 helix-turn-helix transcriptional regulator [Bifidobacterium sp. ESL0764]
MDDLDRYIAERKSRDPKFAEEYERSRPEHEAAIAIMGARIEAHMTQAEVAKRCGMRPSNYSRIERGNSIPTVRTLAQIAKGLGRKLKIEFV